MNEQSVLNVLMYLFHNHMTKHDRLNLHDSKIIAELKSAGFHAHSIGRAFRWLGNLIDLSDHLPKASSHSFRIFSEDELNLMSDDCRGFVISLESQGILTPMTREIVIHQIMELIHEGIDLPLMKWVTFMVLFNIPNCDEALKHMDLLVNADTYDTVH